jgi:hypothetical protein
MSGYEGYSLLALPLNSRGDISKSDKIVWSIDKGTPYVPSPVLYDGMLYFTQSNQAILTAVDSQTGVTRLEHLLVTRRRGRACVLYRSQWRDGCPQPFQ